MNKLHSYILALVLALAGLAIFFYKVYFLSFPLLSDQRASLWAIEAHISFSGKEKPAKLSVFIPKTTKQFLLMDESFISRGFGLTTQFVEGNRQATWSIRKATGQQGLYYRAIVRQGGTDGQPDKTRSVDIPSPSYEGARLEAVKGLLADIRARSADVQSLVATLLRTLARPAENSNAELLLGKKPNDLKRAQVAVSVLTEAGVRARVVHGIRLEEPVRKVSFIERLEVFENNAWTSFDLKDGPAGPVSDFLPWWRGDQPLAQLDGGGQLHVTVSVDRYEEDAVAGAVFGGQVKNPGLLEFSLFSLPIETQRVYHILLMIPLGALLIVLLRNVIGLQTFGTFMPVLVALAFRETELLWGIFLFVLIVGLGLVARFYLEQLKLILVPRLAAVLTIVVIVMACLSILTHKAGLESGLSLALFPMVIMTMTIERMSIVWDELGGLHALKQGAGSLFAASLVYLVISIKQLQHLMFVFPELLLVILACMLLLGHYTGYRLLELHRFRAFGQEFE